MTQNVAEKQKAMPSSSQLHPPANPATAAAPPASQRNHPRKTGRGKQNKKTNHNRSSSSNKQMISKKIPQLKINVRNIQNAEAFGSASNVIDKILMPLLKIAQEKTDPSTTTPVLVFDQMSFQQAIDIEKAVLQLQKKEEDEDALPVDPSPTTEPKRLEKDTPSTKPPLLEDHQILVRLLYVVPPRKTRRRGEKPGNAYLLCQTQAPSPTQLDGTDPRSAAAAAFAHKEHQLRRFLEVLQQIAMEDAKSSQTYAGCQVEESINLSSITQVFLSPKDKFENTIFETEHYQEFLAKQSKQREQLNSRAKPAPGGGLVALADSSEAPVPVSALVQFHLRKKKPKQNKVKQSKTKGDTKQKTSADKKPKKNPRGKSQKKASETAKST